MKAKPYIIIVVILAAICTACSRNPENIPAETPNIAINPFPSIIPSARNAPLTARPTASTLKGATTQVLQPTLESLALADMVRQDLAGRLGVQVAEVRVLVISPEYWNYRCLDDADASQERPADEDNNLRLTLSVEGVYYAYHSDNLGNFCPLSSGSLEWQGEGLLEIHRQSPDQRFCDRWVVGEADVSWSDPCNGGWMPPVFVNSARSEALRQLVNEFGPLTETLDGPAPLEARLNGRGDRPPTPEARAALRQMLQWLANPAGEGDPGSCTYTDNNLGYSLDYPCNWEVDAPAGPLSGPMFYSPGRGLRYAPPFAKVEVYPPQVNKAGTPEAPSLESMMEELEEAGAVQRAETTMNGIPAVIAELENEMGNSLALYLVADGRGFRLIGYGDLESAEQVMRTFRVP